MTRMVWNEKRYAASVDNVFVEVDGDTFAEAVSDRQKVLIEEYGVSEDTALGIAQTEVSEVLYWLGNFPMNGVFLNGVEQI